MSLRSKILLILSVVVLTNVAADNLIQRFMVSESFVALERQEARRDLERAVETLHWELDSLRDQARRWGVWNQTQRFVDEPYEDYLTTNLGPTALKDAGLNLLYVVDLENRVVWGRIESSDDRAPIRLRDFPDQLDSFHPLLYSRDALSPELEDQIAGLMVTERGPLLVSGSPILTSQGRGPSRGRLIVGRFLDQELIAEVGERVQVELDFWQLSDPDMPERERGLIDQVTASPDPITDELDDEHLNVYATFPDIREAPALMLRATVDREITKEGLTSVRYALLSTLGAALLILTVLLRLLQRMVLRPLGHLTEHAVRIGRTDDTSVKVGMERDDEIGLLAKEFDRMMVKLAKSRSDHAETARLVGMSEIATGVLHNVGNVLNSVNVSTNQVLRKTQRLPVGDLQMMAETLQGHAQDLARFITEDPRGSHMLPFLDELSSAMKGQKESILEELANLSRGIEHLMELVRSQQTYAGRGGLLELTSIEEQVEGALAICQQAHAGSYDVELTREFEAVPPIQVDRRKLTEILVNLIQNARQAMLESKGDAMRLTLRIRRSDSGKLRIEVADNGAGISKENITRIFNHGFTTKKDGHGFGLHSSANLATEMHSRLWAESDGEGKGAVFIIEIPMDLSSQKVAA